MPKKRRNMRWWLRRRILSSRVIPKKNHLQQLWTNNVFTYNVETPNRTDSGGELWTLVCLGLFTKEHKRCHIGTSETNGKDDLPSINQHIFKESKERRTNGDMSDKKTCDVVMQFWSVDCLKMYKIFANVIKFIKETMKNSKVEKTARVKSLAEIKIQWHPTGRNTVAMSICNSNGAVHI